MEKTRDSTMDIVKGIGILAIILGHVGVKYLTPIFYIFHVPLFFIVAGYFLNDQNSFEEFFNKKCKGYVLPYIFCALVLAAFSWMRAGFQYEVLLQNIGNFCIQKRYTTLWFLSALFLGNCIFKIITIISKNRIDLITLGAVLISTAFILYDEFGAGPLPWNVDIACISLIFMWFGYYLKKRNIVQKIKEISWKSRIIWIFATGGICTACTLINNAICHESLEMFKSQYGIFPLTIVAACAATMTVIIFSTYITKANWLKWLGKNTMAFFAFHQDIGIVITCWIADCFIKFPYNFWGMFFQKTFIIAGTLLICYLMHIIIIKLHLGFLLGKL